MNQDCRVSVTVGREKWVWKELLSKIYIYKRSGILRHKHTVLSEGHKESWCGQNMMPKERASRGEGMKISAKLRFYSE